MGQVLILYLALDSRYIRSSKASCRQGSSSFCSSFYSSILCSSSSNSKGSSSRFSSSSSRRSQYSISSIRDHLRRLVSLGLVRVLPVVEPVVREPEEVLVSVLGQRYSPNMLRWTSL